MIRVTDATRLAATKLRTRKVRLIITIVIAGLLFSVLAAASQVSRGAFSSFDTFNKEGFGERFILSANLMTGPMDPFRDPKVADRATAIHKELIAQKTAEAKRLNIPYDSKAEPPPITEFDTGNGKERSVNPDTEAGKQAIAEYATANKLPGMPELRSSATPYGAKAFYSTKSRMFSSDSSTLKVLENGKEAFDQYKLNSSPPSMTGLDSFAQSWALMNRDLFKPFMLQGASATIGKDGSIPVVAPYSAVEQLLGLKALPAGASSEERLERIRQIRTGASAITFDVCYRNNESVALINMAFEQQQEIERNKKDKNYVRPSLQYGLPTQTCGAAPVVRDVRTAAEKTLDAKQLQFDTKFGKQAPAQQLMKFRVIGIAPDPPDFNASAASALVSMLVSSNLGMGLSTWFTPLELESQHPLLASMFKEDLSNPSAALSASNYVEFSDAASAKKYYEEKSCNVFIEPSIAAGPPTGDPFAMSNACFKEGKYFGYVPFGSNSLALEDAKRAFAKVFSFAALGVAAIAGIIMIGMVGRTIADSRRETAVFRAIGAKKIDIVLVYVLYAIFLSVLIYLFALIVGFLLAQYFHGRYSPEFTVQSLIAYNAQDLTKVFSLYEFHVPDMLRLLGLSLAGGLLSAFLPLLRNLRRNPINDMRDDT